MAALAQPEAATRAQEDRSARRPPASVFYRRVVMQAASSVRRGAKQLSPRHNSVDRLGGARGALGKGWMPLESSSPDADTDAAHETTATLQLQPDDEIQRAHSAVSVDQVQVNGADQHPKQRGPPPVPPEALPGRHKQPPSETEVGEDVLGFQHMNGSLERAVRVLGGDAPPLDDALAGLNQARDLELAADDEMSALTVELSQILTPVKPLSPAKPLLPRLPETSDQQMSPGSSACSSLRCFVPTTVILMLSGTSCCYQFWLKARCDEPSREGPVAIVAGVGFAIFWACVIHGHLDCQQLIRPGGPLKRLAQTSPNSGPERATWLERVAWMYTAAGFIVSMWFVALAVGIVGLACADSANFPCGYAPRFLTQAATDFFSPQGGCEAGSVSTTDVQRSYSLGLITAAGGCILVWRHIALAISAAHGGMIGVDAIRKIRCHVTRGALDVWDHRQLSTFEKQQWRDACGTCLATRFNDETWNEQLVLPVIRLTRCTLPTLSAWSPALSSMAIGASALVLGITPFALATKNILAIALPPCALLIPTLQALPILRVSAECNALRAALNDALLECRPDLDDPVDLDSVRDKNVQRVSGLLEYLERLNLGQGPGVVGCGGVLLTRRLYIGWLASLVVVVAGWATGFTYYE